MATMAMAEAPRLTPRLPEIAHAWPWRRAGWFSAWEWARQRLPHALKPQVFLSPEAFDQIRVTARTAQEAAAVRILARLHRDPVWRRAWHRDATWEGLEEAGLLDDRLPVGQIDRWRRGCAGPGLSPWFTPATFTRHDLILLVPGSFAPVHPGHLAMVKAAIARAQAAGYRVLGVVWSASHDSYVLRKPGAANWFATRRLPLLAQAAATLCEDVGVPVVVDAWESQGVPVGLNHTDVLERYRATWQALHPGHAVRVGLVAGADNAGFARTATRRHPVFIVGRPGWSLPTTWPRGAWGCPGAADFASRTYRQIVAPTARITPAQV